MSSTRPSPPIATAAGTLAETPLANALVYLRSRGLTGTFDLATAGPKTARFFVWKGFIVHVAMKPAYARFADVAYELGFVSVESLTRVSMESQLIRRAPADILLESASITSAERDLTCLEQIRRRVSLAFTFPEDATYTFSEAIPSPVEPAVKLDPLEPVWHALIASPPDAALERIRALVGDGPLTLLPEANLDRTNLGADEAAVLERLGRGPASIDDLREASKLPPERLDVLAYLLVMARCAAPVEPRGAAKPAPTPVRSAVADAPTLKVPKWRSFQLSLVEIQEAVAAKAARTDGKTPPSSAPRPVNPKPPSPAELGVDGIRERAARIAFETPLAALGLPEDSSIEAARAAYVHAARVWHPHRLPPELDEVAAEAACVYMHILAAYGSLSEETTLEQDVGA